LARRNAAGGENSEKLDNENITALSDHNKPAVMMG